jgi:phage terminase small subunit
MAALRNPKHEVFAVAVNNGRTEKEAALIAGYTPFKALKTGSILKSETSIQARIQELQETRRS